MYYCIFSSLTQVVCYDSSYKHLPMKSLPQYGRAFFLSSPFWNVEMIIVLENKTEVDDLECNSEMVLWKMYFSGKKN